MITNNLLTNQALLGVLLWLVIWSGKKGIQFNVLPPSRLTRFIRGRALEAAALMTFVGLGNLGLIQWVKSLENLSGFWILALENALAIALAVGVALSIRGLWLLTRYAGFIWICARQNRDLVRSANYLPKANWSRTDLAHLPVVNSERRPY